MDTIKTPLALFVWLQAQLAIAGPRRNASACHAEILLHESASIAAAGLTYGMHEKCWDEMLRALKSPVGSLLTEAEEQFAHFAMSRLASFGGKMTTNDANIAMIYALGMSAQFAIEGAPGQRYLVRTEPLALGAGVGVRVRVAGGIAFD